LKQNQLTTHTTTVLRYLSVRKQIYLLIMKARPDTLLFVDVILKKKQELFAGTSYLQCILFVKCFTITVGKSKQGKVWYSRATDGSLQ